MLVMIFGQMDSICAPHPDVSRAGSNTVVTLPGIAPTHPFLPGKPSTTPRPPHQRKIPAADLTGQRQGPGEGTGKAGGHTGLGANS